MKTLILYSTILGAFYAQSENMECAVRSARNEAGDDAWKRGFTGSTQGGATAIARKHFREYQIEPAVVEGEISYVGFVMNRDEAGNEYPKLRVGLVNPAGDQLMLSLDVKTDVAQRLIVKLDNCMPGQFIKISAWASPVERDGRTFINHAASVKDSNDKEIPANSVFSKTVKEVCDGVERTLRTAGISDKKVIATAKATKRIDEFKGMLLRIQNVFSTNNNCATA